MRRRRGAGGLAVQIGLAGALALALAGALAGATAGSRAASSCPPPPSSAYGSAVVATPGLVGYWRLGESSGTTACDAFGTSNATITGSVTLGQAGALSGDPDTAARFALGGEADAPSAPALNLNDAFSIELWARPQTAAAATYPGLLRKGSSWMSTASGGWLLWYWPSSGVLTFKRQATEVTSAAWKLTYGSWSHVALTYDGAAANTLRLYLDGQQVAQTAGPPGGYVALSSADPLQIGNGDDGSGDQTVDEVALYSTALSAATVQSHYQTGAGLVGAPPAPTGLTAASGPSSVSLSWTASQNATGYRVYRRNADGSWPATPVGTSAAASYEDAAVTIGSPYAYRVTAVNASGTESSPSNVATTAMPVGFQAVTVVAGLDKPTAVAWTPDGRMLIAEKTGRLRVVSAAGVLQSTPVLDLTAQINSYEDRGLLGLAVDASFASNHYVYLLYTVESAPGTPDTSAPMASRLTRIQLNDDNTLVDPGSPQTVLVGTQSTAPCGAPSNTNDCIPSDGTSHSIGTVRAAPDGTLWLGSGDAASYSQVDALAFRTYDETSLAGKILHVDRNGNGLPGHPFCPADTDLTHVCTKLAAKGFRNPFRFTLAPSGSVFVGDVGWNTREEIDLLRGGGNFGWPCYEGTLRTASYKDDSRCPPEYAKEGTASADVGPLVDYDHNALGGGGAVVVGPQYSGAAYPASFAGSVFYGDYVHGFVKRLLVDGSNAVVGSADFVDSGWLGVDVEQAPDGSVVWADPGNWAPGGGSIKRWVANQPAANQPPTAVAAASPTAGVPPLQVQLTGSGSSDPDGDTLVYDWDFGDGSAHESVANPAHTYTTVGTYTATLRVDDNHAHSATATVQVTVTENTPPQLAVTSPADGSLYRDGQAIALKASATDAQDGPLPAAALSWHVMLHHGSHIHDLGTLTGASTSFTTQTDHDADSYYEIVATATDSGGMTAAQTITIRPQTVLLTLASSPAGAGVSFGGVAYTANATLTTVPGYRVGISAATSFVSNRRMYFWRAWSDGGARVHTITVPTTSSTVTANYRRR